MPQYFAKDIGDIPALPLIDKTCTDVAVIMARHRNIAVMFRELLTACLLSPSIRYGQRT